VDSVEQNTTPTVSFTYAEDGVAVNPSPDSATVTVTRADGTALHTNAATTDGGTGIFRYVLSASDTSLLDTLTLEWHIGTQTFTTTVQVQGGFYFTIAEAKALTELASKSAAEIAAAARSPSKPSSTPPATPSYRATRARRSVPSTAPSCACRSARCARSGRSARPRASAARRRRSRRPTTPRPRTASTAPPPGRPARTTWSSATSTAPTSRRSASSARSCSGEDVAHDRPDR
jgi:hypothetical protein